MENENKDAQLKQLQERIKALEAEVEAIAQPERQDGAETEAAPEAENFAAPEDEKQAEAEKKYQTLFGDKRRAVKSGSRKYSWILVVILAAAFLLYALFRTPSGFKTPPSADAIGDFGTRFELAEWKDWANFYADAALVRPETAVKAGECNVIFSADDGLYANIFCYEFASASDAEAYITKIAGENGGTPETDSKFGTPYGQYKNEDLSAKNYVYIGWFNGGKAVAIYATDAVTANWMRARINEIY